ARIEQAVHEPLPRGVDHAHHPRTALAIGQRGGGNIGNQVQGARIEYLHAAGFVVAHGDQGAVLADGAAYAVASLDDALVDAPGQQVDLGQPAVAAEDVRIALVAREHHRGVREVAQALHAG